MKVRAALAVLAMGQLATVAQANCGHHHKATPLDGVICISQRQWKCGAMGAWHPIPGSCVVDPADQTSAMSKQPSVPAADKPVADKPAGPAPKPQ